MAGQGLLLSMMLFRVAGCRQEFRLYDLQIANCKAALGGNLLRKFVGSTGVVTAPKVIMFCEVEGPGHKLSVCAVNSDVVYKRVWRVALNEDHIVSANHGYGCFYNTNQAPAQ